MKLMKKRIVAAVLVVAMTLGGTQMAYATASARYQEELSEAELEKDEVQANLDQVAEQIEAIEQQQAELQERIDELDAELVEVLVDIATTQGDIEKAELRVAQAQTSLAVAKATEQEQLNSMRARIRYMYENGDMSLFTALIESNSFAQVLNKMDSYSAVYEYDRSMLEEYQETKQQVEDLVAEVAEEEAELEMLEVTLEEQQEELEAEKAKRAEEIADFDVQMEEAEALAEEYEATINDMDAQIEALQEALELAIAAETEAAIQAGSSNVSYDSEKGAAVVSYACQFIGNKYVWGGESLTNGCDCSGFVMKVYEHFGVSLPHSSTAMRYVGTGVSVASMMPGDIVCYSGHVGIYVGNGKIVNASNSKPYPAGGIKYSNVYNRTILAVRRIFT